VNSFDGVSICEKPGNGCYNQRALLFVFQEPVQEVQEERVLVTSDHEKDFEINATVDLRFASMNESASGRFAF